MTIPVVTSARIRFANSCDGEAHVERIEGRDSVLIRALDHETPPEPGKPFDVTLMQQVPVVSGTDYSLSGWMLTLCGGSFSDPNDCPEGYYMAKLLGIDPDGRHRSFCAHGGMGREPAQFCRAGRRAHASAGRICARHPRRRR